MKNFSRGFGTLTVSIIVIVLLIAGTAAAYGVYSWQHNKVNTLTNKVNSLNSNIDNLNGEISLLSEQVNKLCPQSQSSTAYQNCSGYRFTSDKGVSILLFTPLNNEQISSPLAIVGEVPGSWSFEARFPIKLKDAGGNTVD